MLPFPPLPPQISISYPKNEFAKVAVQSDAQGNGLQILYGKLGVLIKCMFGEKTKVSMMRMDFWKILAHSLPPCLSTHSCVNASFSLVGTPRFEYQCNIQLTLCLGDFLVKYSIFISFLISLLFSMWSFM